MTNIEYASGYIPVGDARYKVVSRFVLWCVLTGILILVPVDYLLGQERGISRLIKAIMLVIMLIYCADMLTRTGVRFIPAICKSVLLLSLLIGVHVVVLPDADFDILSRYAIHLFWVIGLLCFYYLAASGVLDRRQITLFLYTFIPLAVVFNYLLTVQRRLVLDRATANAYAYPLLWFLPIVLTVVKGWSRIVLLACGVLAITFTFKRGAILAMALCWIAYVVTLPRSRHGVKWLKGIVVTLVMVAIAVAVLASHRDLVERRTRDLHRWESAGSGRGNLYSILWEHWLEGDAVEELFGYGYRGIPRLLWPEVAVEYAHSDWFTVLHDYGILGVLVLANIHVFMLLTIRRAFRTRADEAVPLLLVYIVFFCVNAYSGQIDYSSLIYMSLPLGYLLGQVERRWRSPCYAPLPKRRNRYSPWLASPMPRVSGRWPLPQAVGSL